MQLQFGTKMEPEMGMNLSIKNVPAEKVERLKQRAKRNHRSLQGELLALVDHAIGAVSHPATTTAAGGFADQGAEFRANPRAQRKLSIDEVVARIKNLNIGGKDEAVQMIREDRDR
jgi:plasmid stability protein